MLARIIYFKTVEQSGGRGIFNRTSNAVKDNKTFDRTFVLMCLNSPPGQNTCIVTMNNNKADTLFGQYLKGRDDANGFGPGAVVAIARPQPIENYFGDRSGIPVLYFHGGMKLINLAASGFTLTTRLSLPDVTRLQAFYYPLVHLKIVNCNLAHTTCCGNLCDSIGMKKYDGNWRPVCPCFSLKRSLGCALFDVNFRVTVLDDDGSPTESGFETLNFTSRSFTSMLTKAGIPMSVNLNMLERCGADDEIIYKLDELVEKINDSLGGFSVLGWVRQGRINDHAALGDAQNGKSEKESIASSSLLHHVTNIRMNCKRSDIADHLIDVTQIFNDFSQ